MHNEIDYGIYTNDAQKRARAIADLIEWFGEERWAKILPDVKTLLKRPDEDAEMTNEDRLRFMMSFGGVQGYPVTALIESIKAGDM